MKSITWDESKRKKDEMIEDGEDVGDNNFLLQLP